jgi:hypothetical protein
MSQSQTSSYDESKHVGPDDVRQIVVDAMGDYRASLEPYCRISPRDQSTTVDYSTYCLQMREVRLHFCCMYVDRTTPIEI